MKIDVGELYSKYGPMVLRRCRYLLKNEPRALDAMQDVFVKLIQKQDSLNADYPSSLLYVMATRVCLNFIRKDKKKHEVKNTDSGIIDQIAVYDDTENNLSFKDLMDNIFKEEPISTREMLVLHHLDGMSLMEVADEFDLSVSGVRKRFRVFQDSTKGIGI